ncbi:hypothetical protein CFOL_v3_13154, partial [Cephalotus follicularis]
GPSHCQSCLGEGLCCSTSYGISNRLIKHSFDGRRTSDLSRIRCRNPLFGSTQLHLFSVGHDHCPSKVSVAADYSDSVPDSSHYTSNQGYHPLEELIVCKRIRETKLTAAEIARTAVEANSSALLVFPGIVHCEPHEQSSWAEFQYIVDDYGDIFFEIYDGENMLQDRGARNPVNALIGMDISLYENKRIGGESSTLDFGIGDDMLFDDDDFEVMDSETVDLPIDWGMPDTPSWVHPIYFARCLTKAVDTEYNKNMDHPSNGVSIMGCLRPAFADEETCLRRHFNTDDSDGYYSDWKDAEILSCSSKDDGSKPRSTLYRFEIMKIELFSVYGVQACTLDPSWSYFLQDFQDAEPDVLVHSTPEIVEQFSERGSRCNVALKALCKKKGLHVERANLIGVDSLGIDVRVFSGVEVWTHRFPFKVRAMSEVAAEKQIQQLLFPRSRRKKFNGHGDGLRDPELL